MHKSHFNLAVLYNFPSCSCSAFLSSAKSKPIHLIATRVTRPLCCDTQLKENNIWFTLLNLSPCTWPLWCWLGSDQDVQTLVYPKKAACSTTKSEGTAALSKWVQIWKSRPCTEGCDLSNPSHLRIFVSGKVWIWIRPSDAVWECHVFIILMIQWQTHADFPRWMVSLSSLDPFILSIACNSHLAFIDNDL